MKAFNARDITSDTFDTASESLESSGVILPCLPIPAETINELATMSVQDICDKEASSRCCPIMTKVMKQVLKIVDIKKASEIETERNKRSCGKRKTGPQICHC